MSHAITHAVIMAAGKGKRMLPLTLTIPKPMVEVLDEPILAHTINELPESITDVVIIVGYLQEVIREYFGETWRGRRITYVEQVELAGTGTSVLLAQPYVSERFLVLNADDLYCRADMERMCAVDGAFAILGMPLSDAGRFSPMRVDSSGYLLGLTTLPTASSPDVDGVSEQKEYSIINTGMYTVHQQYFSWAPVQIPGGSEFGLPHTIAAHCHEVPVQVVPGTFWYPIGFPEDLEGAAMALAEYRGRDTKSSENK